jgi:hypothetical protein
MVYVFIFISTSLEADMEAVQKELKDDDESLPKLLVAGIALIGLGLLIANTALVAWFIIRKRIKGKKTKRRGQKKQQAESNTEAIFSFCFI